MKNQPLIDVSTFRFREPLIEGIVRERPNRFVMLVDVAGRITRCFCPCPTRIGNLIFEGIPCLLSQNSNSKTEYTVEAISLNSIKCKKKQWIGINQTKVNRYIKQFFLTGQLNNIFKKIVSLRREFKLANTRIDFLINSCLVEVKTPLTILPFQSHLEYKSEKDYSNSHDRTVKHYELLSKHHKGMLKRAIILHCFMYRAPEYSNLFRIITDRGMQKSVKKAIAMGVENWQVNMTINPRGIKLIDYFKLNKLHDAHINH